jgi:hypothetical protein
MLEEELKLSVLSNCRGRLANGVVSDHDNSLPHMAAVTIEMI